jgi:peptide/nickel transport system substrate-binding protein
VLAPTNDPTRREAGRQVVLALRRAGARAQLVELSRARLERATGADGTTPNFAAAIQSIPALASYDPDGLTRLFGSDPRLAPLNVGGYRSSAFDALARRVAVAPDVPARLRATRVELELLARDAPAVPLFFAQGTFAYRPAIYNGWIFVKGTGILDKRSLLPGAAAGRRPQPTPDLSPSPGPDSGSGLDALNVVSLAVLAVVVVLAALALLQRRSDRRRR